MQVGHACFPGSLLSFLSSATEPPISCTVFILKLSASCIFFQTVLGDKTEEEKQITTEAHLPVVRACHQQSIPASSPRMPRKISLTFELLLNMGFLHLGLSTSAQPTLIFPSLSTLMLSPWNPAPYQTAEWVNCLFCVLSASWPDS